MTENLPDDPFPYEWLEVGWQLLVAICEADTHDEAQRAIGALSTEELQAIVLNTAYLRKKAQLGDDFERWLS